MSVMEFLVALRNSFNLTKADINITFFFSPIRLIFPEGHFWTAASFSETTSCLRCSSILLKSSITPWAVACKHGWGESKMQPLHIGRNKQIYIGSFHFHSQEQRLVFISCLLGWLRCLFSLCRIPELQNSDLLRKMLFWMLDKLAASDHQAGAVLGHRCFSFF